MGQLLHKAAGILPQHSRDWGVILNTGAEEGGNWVSRKPQTLGCFFFSLKRQLWTSHKLVLIPTPTQPHAHADHSGAGEGMGTCLSQPNPGWGSNTSASCCWLQGLQEACGHSLGGQAICTISKSLLLEGEASKQMPIWSSCTSCFRIRELGVGLNTPVLLPQPTEVCLHPWLLFSGSWHTVRS